MSLAPVTDHEAAGLSLLLYQYQDKPRLLALALTELRQIQALEDAIWDVILSRLIDDAVDQQLDVLGRIVGQARQSSDDEVFRARIKTRIRANRSNAHPSDLIQVGLLASGVSESDAEYREAYPAGFIFETIVPVEAGVAAVVDEFLRVAKGPGIQASYYWFDVPLGEAFTFAEGDFEEDDTARGFGGDDPDVGPGGVWIGAY